MTVTATILGATCKGTPHQIERMKYLEDRELYWTDEFNKYFKVGSLFGLGLYFYPKKKYFVSDNSETDYEVALRKRFGL